MLLQVAQRREHADCVRLLRQHEAACPAAVDQPGGLHSCAIHRQGPSGTAFLDHHQHQGAQQGSSVPGQYAHLTTCTSGGAVGVDSKFGGLPACSSSSHPLSTAATSPAAASHCVQRSCGAAPCASHALRDPKWQHAVPREQGQAWMKAAKAGDVPALETQLKSNVCLLAYRGQGTSFGFGGMIRAAVILTILYTLTASRYGGGAA